MQTWEYIWEFTINLVETALLVVFIEDKLTRTKLFSEKCAKLCIIVFVIADTLRTSLMNYYSIPYEINYLASLIIFSVFAIFLYGDKVPRRIFISSLYVAILFASDTIASTLPTAIFDTELPSMLIGGSLRFAATLFYISCIASLVFISHFVKWKIISMSPVETIFFIIVSTIGLFFGQYLASLYIYSFERFHDAAFTNKLILISVIYCFLYLILLAYIYILSSTKEQNRKLIADNQQLLLEEVNYKNLIETTASLRKLKHDMQHHLLTIKYLANENNLDELDDYVTRYMGTLEDMHKFVSTGNSAIDCILSTSIPRAKEMGINVNSTLTVPESFKLDPILTSSLLGNLWTNSITACKRIIDSNLTIEPFIDFYIKPIENMLLISMKNSFDGKAIKDSIGNYISTKNNSYGIGLRRISEIVEQNDGIMEVTDKDNIFCVHIMFPLKEIISNENCNS